MEQVEWKGIAEERFRPYKQWVTPSGYLCGSRLFGLLSRLHR